VKRVIIFVMLVLLGGFLFSSCSRDKKGSKGEGQQMGEREIPGEWKFTLPKGNASEGRKIFVELECYKCHEIKGETFPGIARGEKGVGPELSQMAGMHPVEFFAESIINPNAVIDPEDKEKGYVGEDGK
jgi:hypothetical protein